MTLAPPSSRGGVTVTRSASSPATRTDTAAGAAGGAVEAEVESMLQPREVQETAVAFKGVVWAPGISSRTGPFAASVALMRKD